MYDLLKEFIKPELLILVPVLYLIGIAIKKSDIQDKHIPSYLGGTGIFLSILYLVGTNPINTTQAILALIFTGITQGILIAGASVYVHQLIKQGKE